MTSRTAHIRALARDDAPAACAALAALLADLFGLRPRGLRISVDRYSLNSLNGFFEDDDGAFFFKFHQEEGEEAMGGEYYRAGILARAGLPVDMPVRISTTPGEQILIYRRRDDPRFSDVLRALDLAPDPVAEARAVAAEADLNDALLAVARATLRPISPADSMAEPIHRLFHNRLADPATGRFPAGRLASFYVGQRFELPGATLDWRDFAAARLVLNGTPYRHGIGTLFEAAAARLAPARMADAGGVTAHGDAHNANVWWCEGRGGPRLALYDPAFAGAAVPTLLAEIKATFHNVFAHPLWLYDAPTAAGRFAVEARFAAGALHIETDWGLTPVREKLLEAKALRYWTPMLATLRDRGLLPADWRDVVRLALFLCPTLVMDLRARPDGRDPATSALAWLVAAMVGGPPERGDDMVTRFLDRIDPG